MSAAPFQVLHLLPDISRGGGQAVVLELVSNCDRERFQPHVARLAPPDDMAAEFTAAGCEPIDPGARGPGLLGGLVRTIGDLGIDVLHVHSERDRKLGQIAALFKGVPVVGHLHSPWAHLEPIYRADSTELGRRFSRLKAAVRGLVEDRAVVQYIAVGDEVARFHEGRVNAPITVVNNGIDTRRFIPATPESRLSARRELGIAADVRVVGFVGRLAMGKGQDVLIATMNLLPQAHLVLIGDGERRGALEQQAADLGVVDRVVFAGDRPDVETVLVAADVFAMASESEGLPLSVLESMACGVPVVAYDLAGLHSVITDGADGRLVAFGEPAELASALSVLLDDDRLRAEMAVAARSTVTSGFDSRLMAEQVQGVYDAALSGRTRARGRKVSDVRCTA